MKVTLEAIQFNHDPDSAMVDAFNIRKNETVPITLPEWRRGCCFGPDDSPAAYSVSEVQGNTITVKAKFKSFDPQLKTAEMRAVEPLYQGSTPGRGCLGLVLPLFPPAPLTGAVGGNVLGRVKARTVSFADNGESDFETFELENSLVEGAGVSSSVTNWQWQFRFGREDPWTNLELTRHRIYTVLHVPKSPWLQTPFDDKQAQAPWTDVLNYACQWAALATEPDEAAALITNSVNDLGHSLVVYSSGSSYVSEDSFDCISFLQLLCDGRGMGQTLNCDDCASIVSTFSNILGCDLWQSHMGLEFDTNPILLIGRRQWERVHFAFHAVAWKGECRKNEGLFDACLQVDGDSEPMEAPHRPLLPVNIRFGRPGDGQYRFRLATPPAAPNLDFCTPTPDGTRKRRALIHGAPARPNTMDNQPLMPPKRLSGIDTFTPSPHLDKVLTSLILFRPGIEFAGWRADRFIVPEAIIPPLTIRSLWDRPGEGGDVLLRVDGYDLVTVDKVKSFLLQVLKGFELNDLKQWESSDKKIGDIAYFQPGNITLIFARSQFVIVVRSAGRKPVPVDDFAFNLDQLLIQ